MKIKNDYFIKKDLRDMLVENESTYELDGGNTTYLIDPDDYGKIVESLIEKVAEFVNENYDLKK